MINDKSEYLTDMYGKYGYLINIGDYYFFQPIELNDPSISIFEKSTPIPFKRDRITLNIKTENVKDFRYGYEVIKLPEHAAHPAFMKTGGEEYGLDENSVKIVMDMLGPAEVGMGAVRIGDLVIAGVPGELTSVLGLKIKQSLKAGGIKYAAIGGLANEWISYILSRDQYINGEGYEASVSFYGPDLGEIISNEAIKTGLTLTQIRYD
jgi:hypothetical protein